MKGAPRLLVDWKTHSKAHTRKCRHRMTTLIRMVAIVMFMAALATSGYAQTGAMTPGQMKMMGGEMKMMGEHMQMMTDRMKSGQRMKL